MKQKKNFWERLLRWLGWTPLFPKERLPKSIICVAPHTSNWDFLIGYLYYKAFDPKRTPRFLMKKELFFFPLSILIKALGGLPVNRKLGASTLEQAIELLKESDHLHIGITPEGSRSRRSHWKSGFYRIALGAGVPIEIAKIDYARKEVGVIGQLIPSGDMEREIAEIRKLFSAEMARYPELYAEEEEEDASK